MNVSLCVAGTLAPDDADRFAAFVAGAKTYAGLLGMDPLPITMVVEEAGSVRQTLTLRRPGTVPLTLPMARTTSYEAARI